MIGKIKVDRGCSACGFNTHPAALDFHHRDGETKSFVIAKDVRRAWSSIEAEIAKCDVLCANCHRIEHSK